MMVERKSEVYTWAVQCRWWWWWWWLASKFVGAFLCTCDGGSGMACYRGPEPHALPIVLRFNMCKGFVRKKASRDSSISMSVPLLSDGCLLRRGAIDSDGHRSSCRAHSAGDEIESRITLHYEASYACIKKRSILPDTCAYLIQPQATAV